jgi:hypothetical protein
MPRHAAREQSSAWREGSAFPCEANDQLADMPFTGPVRRTCPSTGPGSPARSATEANGRASALPGTRTTTPGPLDAGAAHRRMRPRCKRPPGSGSPHRPRPDSRIGRKRELTLLIGERSITGQMQKSCFGSSMRTPHFALRRAPRPTEQATCNARIGRARRPACSQRSR